MDNKWREACRRLQSEGVKFAYRPSNNTDWGRPGICNFSDNLDLYRIAQQLIPNRPDWREWCRKLQNECDVTFERLSDNSQKWRETKCYFDSYDLSHYRIAQQPIPEQIGNYLQEEQMTDKIMMDGEPLKVGDRVYCLLKGAVIFNGVSDGDFPIVCTALNGVKYEYTKNFTYHRYGLRTLFWQKPEIIPPPKPKKRVKVWDWFVETKLGSVHKWIAYTENQMTANPHMEIVQKIDGTEREIEQ